MLFVAYCWNYQFCLPIASLFQVHSKW